MELHVRHPWADGCALNSMMNMLINEIRECETEGAARYGADLVTDLYEPFVCVPVVGTDAQHAGVKLTALHAAE